MLHAQQDAFAYNKDDDDDDDDLATLSSWKLCIINEKTTRECIAVGGMRNGNGYRWTRRKPVTAQHYPPQIPLDLTLD
jgi:hypothetical protein